MDVAFKLGCLALVIVLLSACTASRYSMTHDAAPKGEFDASLVPDAIPIWEPLSRGGNKSPYKVRGKTYTVLPSAEGYVEEGISSWYGLKFHGELTSNGEIYNMYEMSAAHKSLPLPSYLRVTNLENQKEVIVRVNDRGPFHSERIIDLSYAAAIKLGFQKKGTARVKLEAITPALPKDSANDQFGTQNQDRLAPFVQIVAFSSLASVQKVERQLAAQLVQKGQDVSKLFIAKSPNRNPPIYRLRMGPFETEKQAKEALSKIKSLGQGSAMVITRSIKGKDY